LIHLTDLAQDDIRIRSLAMTLACRSLIAGSKRAGLGAASI